MTNKSIVLRAWHMNNVQLNAVQGESNSREISIQLMEDADTENTSENSEIKDKPIDLTGCAVRLYCEKPDGTKIFCDGTVTDGPNGIATVTLPYQTTTVSGHVDCQLLVTKADNTALKVTGLTIYVQLSVLDGAVVSTGEYSALVNAFDSVDSSVSVAKAAAQNANNEADVAAAAADEANTAAGSVNSAAKSANAAAQNANSKAETANTAAGLANMASQNANTAATAANNTANQLKATAVPMSRTIAGFPLSANITAAQLVAAGLAAGSVSGSANNALKLGGVDAASFPQVSSGAWAPTLYGGTTAGNPTYMYHSGIYYRIGNIVFAFCDIEISSKGGMAGEVHIGGLPVAPSGYGRGDFVLAGRCSGFALPNGYVLCGSVSNPDGITLNGISNAGNAAVDAGQLSDTFKTWSSISGWYYVG